MTSPPPLPSWRPGWWEEAFPRSRNLSEIRGHPRGNPVMLVIIAYDITDPKRLKKVADCCKDFGLRVQYSVFECRLESDRLAELWRRLCALADPEEDKLIAYPIHGGDVRKIKIYGRMISNDAVVSYLF
ncbi:MAG: CRISPR-associated endonuclease Cas2 [Puniceicoccaceae bacterium]|nr:MAG: CRISPR-associated endonuclease Cas2 [Puniceicoccaceae bacterium]